MLAFNSIIPKKSQLFLLLLFLLPLPLSQCGINMNEKVLESASKGMATKVDDSIRMHSADPNTTDRQGRTPLMLAVKSGSLETVKVMVAFEVDLNHQDEEGWTALTYAADGGFDRIVAYLIQSGADVNRATNYGNTPLHWAAVQGHVGAIHHLLNAQADPHLKNKKDKTPVEVAKDPLTRDLLKSQDQNP